MEPSLQELEAAIHKTHWWFEGRRRILKRFLGGMQIPSSAAVLEVGCGTGANGSALQSFHRAIGLDRSSFALRQCGPGYKSRLLADLLQMPFTSEAVDLVLAADVLEHMDDDAAALREIQRVLKKGGRMLALVPAFEMLWGDQDDLSHHRRRYGKENLARAVVAAGFRIRRLTFFNITFFLPILVARKLLRLLRRPLRSDNELTTPLLNRILAPIFAAEGYLLPYLNLPVGVSLLVEAEKL